MSSMQALGGAQLPGAPHGHDPRNPLYMTDDFMMYCFKVLPCEKTYRHDWWACPFVHPGESAKRRDPRKYRYTAVACPNAKQGGHCPRGDKCPGTHSVFEYWLHPSRFRTQFCDRGIHCNQPFCFFAHTVEQLRMPAPNDYSEGTQSSGASEGNRSRSGSFDSISPRELQNQMFAGSPTSPAMERRVSVECCGPTSAWDHAPAQRMQRHSMSDFPHGAAMFDGGSPRLDRRFSGGRPRQDSGNFSMFQHMGAVQPDFARQPAGGHLRSLSLAQDIGLIQDLLQKMSAGPVHPPPPQVMPPPPAGMPYSWPNSIAELGSPNSPLVGPNGAPPPPVDPHHMGKPTQDIAVEGVLSQLGLDLVSRPLV
ncbi:hypothetical protein BSKO_05125 [Bryopsis sp. KO-2023]|nr:hypothetical protein BSKO_05125 [Bryopsis sp. KO-2023]